MSYYQRYPSTMSSPAEYATGNPVHCAYCGTQFDYDDDGAEFYDPGWGKYLVVCKDDSCLEKFSKESPDEFRECVEYAQKRREAEAEADFQKNVAGPLLGLES